MEPLNGLDAAFLHFESPRTHLHVGMAAIFDAASVRPSPAVDRVRALVASRLHLVPPFRRKLAPAMGGWRPLRWVDDDDFDLDDHVFAVPALAALTPETVAAVAAEVMRHPLDRTKPLWELYVLEGHDDARVAIVAKVHHAAIDGVSGLSLLANLVDFAPDQPAPEAPAVEAPVAGARSAPTMPLVWSWFAAIAEDFAHDMERISAAAARTQAGRAVGVDPPQPAASTGRQLAAAPRTSLTRPISDRRAVAFCTLPMDDLGRVKKSLGGTLNDVVLAVSGGALLDFLRDRGDEFDSPLVAAVPVSLRVGGDDEPSGNLVSAMFVSLATDEPDVEARYRTIVANTVAAKRRELRTRPSALASDVLSLVRPVYARPLGRLVARATASGRLPSPCNVVVSNIPGPPLTMYASGMAMSSVYPLGPITDGVPLNVTVLSYRDELHVGLLACPRAVPDLQDLPGRLHTALDALVARCS
jgi:diacylglycerol O-acyltransferase / wax synthase